MRYGQYVVEIQSIDVPSPDESVPPWLHDLAREAGDRLAERAPRE